jgi:hypothetical protein
MYFGAGLLLWLSKSLIATQLMINFRGSIAGTLMAGLEAGPVASHERFYTMNPDIWWRRERVGSKKSGFINCDMAGSFRKGISSRKNHGLYFLNEQTKKGHCLDYRPRTPYVPMVPRKAPPKPCPVSPRSHFSRSKTIKAYTEDQNERTANSIDRLAVTGFLCNPESETSAPFPITRDTKQTKDARNKRLKWGPDRKYHHTLGGNGLHTVQKNVWKQA